MSITNKDIKELYGKAAGRCSICRKELFENDVNLGEMAHIIAKSQNGPRGNSSYPGNINEYNNLILLCLEHHRIVDRDPNYYSEDLLRGYKATHENWVDTQLNTNKLHEEDSEFLRCYLSYVPFLDLEHFIDTLPNSVDLNFFDFIDMFEACCKDNRHLYPLNNNFYLNEFISKCNELMYIIRRQVTDEDGWQKSIFEESINNKIFLNKNISFNNLNKICIELKTKRDEVLYKYQDFITFIRTYHPEIDLRVCGKKYYGN